MALLAEKKMGELLQRFWETTIRVQPHGLHTQLINIVVVAEIINKADDDVHTLLGSCIPCSFGVKPTGKISELAC